MTAAPDPRLVLEACGLRLADLPPEQQEVLLGLSAEELAVLVEVRRRLDESGPEVVAHQQRTVGGLLF
ncbi:aroma-sacti cluster domain-containing protein [Spongiactinospora sp. TRM90649]|uniref:aroma-sacti cluster domain-containing protein n=1 Tax=Spongiactinospora sp. TRM90649 TaxID=3031114 RepID=UPI0023F93E6A|nr:aroma-sacti cluster domain-containing protein [Spongiactinospora sp. TRM90649]MDF5759103.1 hypothetical protein [Spongiactinospora sp. TRM90649]